MKGRWVAGGLTFGSLLLLGGAALPACSSDDNQATKPVTVDAGEPPSCDGGSCSTPVAVTGGGSNVCQDATHALQRQANGTFVVVDCPAGTACTGGGVCKGAFVVGSSTCAGLGTLATSTDGLTQTLTSCAVGELCVTTGDLAGIASAACKKSDCIPTTPNVAFCGNPAAPAAEQASAVSKCTATPDGYKLVTSLCPSPSTCLPGQGASINNNVVVAPTDASCGTVCVPGATKCSTSSILTTCDATGNWSSPTACGVGKACLVPSATPTRAVCGDAACARGVGVCSGSNLKACDASGNLAADATACASGACVGDGLGAGGGVCFAQCQAGEERCVGDNGTSYQTCVNGSWSATATSCASNGRCATYTNAGKSAKVCGAECTPGTKRCTFGDGGVGGDSAIATCDATGHWAAASACAVGRCTATGTDAACVADCVPNSLVCTGGSTGVPGTPYAGTTAFQTCSATGLLGGAPTACADGTYCRAKNGVTLAAAGATNACTTCIGSSVAGGNESGLVDSRCSDAAGDATGTAGSQTCSAAGTWTADGVTACANGCNGPAASSGPLAPVCAKTRRGDPKTQTYFAARKRGSCSNANQGTPVSCGAVADCCSNACTSPVPARPATCSAP